MKLSILVPVYNERYWLTTLWNSLKDLPLGEVPAIQSVEIILVDDGSDDGSSQILADLFSKPFPLSCGLAADVVLLQNERNRGKGYSLRKAVEKSSGDVVIIQDSDLEYSPQDFPRLIQPIVSEGADLVIGNRFSGECVRALYYWHSVFNRFMNAFANVVDNLTLHDRLCGYKAFRGSLLRSFDLKSDGFGIECELVSKAANAKARIYEVPVRYDARTYEEGKKIRRFDFIHIIALIAWFGLIRREPFKPGLYQTLTKLDDVSRVIYAPLLHKSLSLLAHRRNLKILEVGAGIGSLTKELVKYGDVTATDISPEYVDHLKTRFGKYTNFAANQWDASKPLPAPSNGFDVIISFNVLEHIDRDEESLGIWRSLLAPGGTMVVLVPYLPKLYTPIDRAVGHFRRYTRKDLCEKIARNDLKIQKVFFGNALGVIGWFINGILLKRSHLPEGQLKLYSLLKPVFTPFELMVEKFFGLSVIVVSTSRAK